MIRAVLDTNIFISALFWRGAPYEVLKAGLAGRFTLLVSAEIIWELKERLKNKFRFPDSDTDEFLEVVTLNSYIVKPVIQLKIVRADPTDNKIIECAIAGQAHFLVSGDRHLLDLKEYRSVKIITPRQFLKNI